MHSSWPSCEPSCLSSTRGPDSYLYLGLVPTLISVLCGLQEGSNMFLAMEFCAGGDLAGYIRRCRRVPEVTACAVMRQLAAGLRQLWSKNLVHVSCCSSSRDGRGMQAH